MREIDDYIDTRVGEEVSQHRASQESQEEKEDQDEGNSSSDEEVDKEKEKVVRCPCTEKMYIISQALDLDTLIGTSILQFIRFEE